MLMNRFKKITNYITLNLLLVGSLLYIKLPDPTKQKFTPGLKMDLLEVYGRNKLMNKLMY